MSPLFQIKKTEDPTSCLHTIWAAVVLNKKEPSPNISGYWELDTQTESSRCHPSCFLFFFCQSNIIMQHKEYLIYDIHLVYFNIDNHKLFNDNTFLRSIASVLSSMVAMCLSFYQHAPYTRRTGAHLVCCTVTLITESFLNLPVVYEVPVHQCKHVASTKSLPCYTRVLRLSEYPGLGTLYNIAKRGQLEIPNW